MPKAAAEMPKRQRIKHRGPAAAVPAAAAVHTVDALHAELERLRAQLRDQAAELAQAKAVCDEHKRLLLRLDVDAAIDAGRLLPTMREWALGIGATNREALNAYLRNSLPPAGR